MPRRVGSMTWVSGRQRPPEEEDEGCRGRGGGLVGKIIIARNPVWVNLTERRQESLKRFDV